MVENIIFADYVTYGLESNHEPSADLAQVQVPMSFMYGSSDDLCPRSVQQRFIDLIPTVESEHDLAGGHFLHEYIQDADFKAELDQILAHSGANINNTWCNQEFEW